MPPTKATRLTYGLGLDKDTAGQTVRPAHLVCHCEPQTDSGTDGKMHVWRWSFRGGLKVIGRRDCLDGAATDHRLPCGPEKLA